MLVVLFSASPRALIQIKSFGRNLYVLARSQELRIEGEYASNHSVCAGGVVRALHVRNIRSGWSELSCAIRKAVRLTSSRVWLRRNCPRRNSVQFYIENIGGAGATIGIANAAKSAPDGYTVLITTQDVVVQPVLRAKVPFDPFKNFTPVSLIVSGPELIVVNPSVPAKTMQELLALIKADPDKYNYTTPGFGTTPHLVGEHLFKITHNLKVAHVPFQGGAAAVQATLARQTQIFMNVVPTVAPYIKEGMLRPLAVVSKTRSRFFPDVPTLEEVGIPKHE